LHRVIRVGKSRQSEGHIAILLVSFTSTGWEGRSTLRS
jgi:hypothetical protein